MDLSIGSRHYHVSVLVLLGVAVGLAWWFARDERDVRALETALDTLWASGKAEVASHAPYLARQRLRDAQVLRERARIFALERDTSRRRQVYDSALHAALAQAAVTPDTTARRLIRGAILGESMACQAIVQNCEARVTAAKQETAFEHAGRLSAEARSVRQDSLIAAAVQREHCRLLHLGPVKIGCPSRAASFKIGAAAGVTVVELLRLLVTGHL